MPTLSNDLWSLTSGRPQIDPADLAVAIEHELLQQPLDFQTRLLIRDGLNAMREFWGVARFEKWLKQSKNSAELSELLRSELGPPGFPYLGRRIMDATRPETVRQFLRELGSPASGTSVDPH